LSRVKKVNGKDVLSDSLDNLRGLPDEVPPAPTNPRFDFDSFSSMVTSASNGATTYRYEYDALDRRTVEHRDGGIDHLLIWDGVTLIANGEPSNLNLDIPGSDIDSHIASVEFLGTGTRRYLHQGADLSTIAASDDRGLIEGYTYSAFGEQTIWDGIGGRQGHSKFQNRFGFQGQLYDALTDTYSMRARQYQPQWGRFLSPDPLSIGAAPSLYAFTESRPLTARDPLGLETVVFCADGGSCDPGFGGSAVNTGFGFLGAVWSEGGQDTWGNRGKDLSHESGVAPDHFQDALRDSVGMVAGPISPSSINCDGNGVCRDQNGQFVGQTTIVTYPIAEFAGRAALNALDISSTIVVNAFASLCGCYSNFRNDNAERLRDRINQRDMEAVRKAGSNGERLSGIAKNTKRIQSISGKTRYRVPDGLDEEVAEELTEVKNAAFLPRLTSQLSDYLLYARQNDLLFILIVRYSTRLGPALQALEKAGEIVVRRILPD
jgi:RHS repeat-associated protein